MILPKLSMSWSTPELVKNLVEWGRLIESDATKVRKTDADVELAGNQRLIVPDTVTGTRYVVSIASGAITLTALT